LIEENANDSDAFVARTRAHQRLGSLPLARQDLDRAIAIERTHRFAHALRGEHLAMLGECQAAAADLSRAIELAGQDSTVWGSVSRVHASLMATGCPEQYDRDLALELARRADAVRPLPRITASSWSGTESALGQTLFRDGQFEEAARTLKRWIGNSPLPDTGDLFVLSMTQAKLGDSSAARKTYDRAVTRMQESSPAYPPYIRIRREAADLLGIE
jgi:tetratricopeptide (TPR) repeat protein